MSILKDIPQDSSLGQLREIADPDALTRALRRKLGVDVRDCRIRRIYYRPDQDCRILIIANVEQQEELFFGCIRDPGLAGAIRLPEWRLDLWPYSQDPDLPGIRLLADANQVLVELRCNPDRFGLVAAPRAIEACRTKYVPGKRCGFLYTAQLGDGSTRTLYAKAYSHGRSATAHRVMRQIADCPGVISPRPLYHDAKLEIVWQEALTGSSLAKTIQDVGDLPRLTREIGRRLAALHGTPVDLEANHTMEHELPELQRKADQIATAFPEHSTASRRLCRSLLDQAAGLGEQPTTTVHGSFKLSHLFKTAGGVAIIDLDGACQGDPAYDLGRFLAGLYRTAAKRKIGSRVAREAARQFRYAYATHVASPLTSERIQWFTASHLLGSEIYKAVKRMDAQLVSRLLRIANDGTTDSSYS